MSPFGPLSPITFGEFGNYRLYDGGGWSVSSDFDSTWTEGHVSTLRFRLDGIRRDVTLKFFATPYGTKVLPRGQGIFVYLNGLFLSYMKEVGTFTASVDVAYGQFALGQNVLHFVLPDAASPASLDEGPDQRVLGFAFERVEMLARPATLPGQGLR